MTWYSPHPSDLGAAGQFLSPFSGFQSYRIGKLLPETRPVGLDAGVEGLGSVCDCGGGLRC